MYTYTCVYVNTCTPIHTDTHKGCFERNSLTCFYGNYSKCRQQQDNFG